MQKSRFYKFIAVMALAGMLGLLGCVSGGGGEPTPAAPAALAVLPGTASVLPGNPTVFTITGGVKGYNVFSTNPTVISFASSAVTNNTFVVNAANVLKDTAVTLTVTDSANARIDFTVNVLVPSSSPLATFPATASGTVGQVLSFVVTGGAPGYSVTSSVPSIAGVSSVNSSGGQYIFTSTLTGIGSDALIITDSSKNTLTVPLTVNAGAALYTSAPSPLAIPVGGTPTSYFIGGGVAPYLATSSNNGVATASVAGSTLTISGVAAGSASILVRDTTGGTPITIAVTVGSSVSIPLFTSAPGTVTVNTGSTSYTIGGGTAPYTATSSNNGVATASVTGATLTITGVSAGVANIVVLDATGTAKSIAVTVGSGAVTPLFTSAPGNVTLGIGSTTYTIGGGTAPYTATSSHNGVATASVSGTTLTLTGVAAGVANVSIRDVTGGAPVTVGVTVSSAATTPLFTNAPGAVTIGMGSTSYTIGGGTPPYSATSSNNGVATASVAGTSLAVTGIAAGLTSIVVFDATGASKTIAVTVGSGAATPLFTSAPDAVTIAIGSTGYSIGGGSAPYTATSSNNGVATASVTGTTLTITGVAAGAANIVLRDATGASKTIAVTVSGGTVTPFFTSAPDAVTIATGSTSYSIGGGSAPYTATSSNNGVATASVTGTTLTITGVAAGVANIVVRDAVGASKTIAVTVGSGAATPLYTSAPANVTLGIGSTSYIIGGGSAPYIASSSNNGVVTASASGTVLTLTGVAAGAANISIRDATGGALVTIAVTVSGAAATPLFTSAPASVTIALGTTNYTIGGGTAPYTATSSNNAVATAGVAGATLVVTGIAAGVTNIVLLDATGASKTIAVTVGSGAATPLFTSAPGSVTVATGSTMYTIGGGTAPYTATSSNNGVATASVSGTTLTISGVAVGVTNIVLLDATGASKTIAVTVGSGAATPLFTSAPGSVTVALGATNYTIGGGSAPYTASSSNNGVATASVSGTTLTINGVLAGVANVVVLDAAGTSKTIVVTVGNGAATPLFTSAPGAITVATAGVATYSIAGGTAPYTASSSNSGVATVSVSSPTMTISGVAAGNASIVVYDATGTSKTIAVTVANSAGTALYTTAPLAVTIAAIGGAQTYTIGGGTAPYKVTSDNTNVASVTTPTSTTFVITGEADGKANVYIQDATGSASVTIAVNVATASGFTVIGSAPAWTIKGNGDGNLSNDCNVASASPYSVYFINGGKPPYTVSSTSPLVGTIIGVGTNSVPLATPSGAKSTAIKDWQVEAGGYYVVAWPNANNNCASGAAQFKVLDSAGAVPAVTPTFTITFTPS